MRNRFWVATWTGCYVAVKLSLRKIAPESHFIREEPIRDGLEESISMVFKQLAGRFEPGRYPAEALPAGAAGSAADSRLSPVAPTGGVRQAGGDRGAVLN